jgi:hypothetical protein
VGKRGREAKVEGNMGEMMMRQRIIIRELIQRGEGNHAAWAKKLSNLLELMGSAIFCCPTVRFPLLSPPHTLD